MTYYTQLPGERTSEWLCRMLAKCKMCLPINKRTINFHPYPLKGTANAVKTAAGKVPECDLEQP